MALRSMFDQLMAAVETLACQDAVLHDRLGEALKTMDGLQRRDFPPDLRRDFDQLDGKAKLVRSWVHQPEIEAEIALGLLHLCLKLTAFTGMVPA